MLLTIDTDKLKDGDDVLIKHNPVKGEWQVFHVSKRIVERVQK
jgi:hypothetical protein